VARWYALRKTKRIAMTKEEFRKTHNFDSYLQIDLIIKGHGIDATPKWFKMHNMTRSLYKKLLIGKIKLK